MSLHVLYEAEIQVPPSGLSRRAWHPALAVDPSTGQLPTLARLRWESDGVEALFSVDGEPMARGGAGEVVVPVAAGLELGLRARGPAGARLRLWLEHDPEGPPIARAILPAFGQRAAANLVSVRVEADRPLAELRVEGREGYAGTAVGDRRVIGVVKLLPLPAEEGALRGLLRDRAGREAGFEIAYRLGEGVRPRVLVLDPLPERLVLRRGEVLTLQGQGLDGARVSWPTNRGWVRRSLDAADGAGRARVPEDAQNGAILVSRGRDLYTIPLEIALSPRLFTRRDRPLREVLPVTGRPELLSVLGRGLEQLEVAWPAETPGGRFNDLLRAFDAALIAADPPGEASVRTWIGVPMENLYTMIDALEAEPGVSVRLPMPPSDDAPDIANIGGAWFWGWQDASGFPRGHAPQDRFILPRLGGGDVYPPTWFLEMSRTPALWNLKTKAKNDIEVLVVDCAEVSQSRDIAISGSFPIPVRPAGSNTPYNHGLNVAGVIGARHDKPGSQVDMEGVNPLVGATGLKSVTTIRAAGVPMCTPQKTVPTELADWDHVAKSIGPNTRVINCSFGADPSRKGAAYSGYINLPYLVQDPDPALLTSIAKVLKGRILRSLRHHLKAKDEKSVKFVANNPKRALGTFDQVVTNLENALKALAPPFTEDAFYDMLGKALTDANLRPELIQTPNWRKIFSIMSGTIVTDKNQEAPKLPEDTDWIPLIVKDNIGAFTDSDTKKALLKGTILLVTSAGNYGTLLPPKAADRGVTRWIGWPTGQRPICHYHGPVKYVRHFEPNVWEEIILVVAGLQLAQAGAELWDSPTCPGVDDAGRGNGTLGVAPGEAIYAGADAVGILEDGTISIGYGTSFAAPFVAGLASYLFALDPGSPTKPADQKLQIKRFLSTLFKGTRLFGGLPSVDAYATARLFLSGVALANPPKEYERAFDRMMCDCDDGTTHGNEKAAAGGPTNSGSAVELLEGDGKINMADFRAFRDAWIQTQLVYPVPDDHKSVMETAADKALRLRDLPATGLEPWAAGYSDTAEYGGLKDKNQKVIKARTLRSLRIWSRFDFDGSGLLEREQLCDAATLAMCREISQGKLLPDVSNNQGYDLALLASLWPDVAAPWPATGVEAPGSTAKLFPEDYEFITDPTQLLSLLPSCDLKITVDGLTSLVDAAKMAAEGGTDVKSIEFRVERGKFNGTTFAADGKASHSRKVTEDRLAAWTARLTKDGEFWLTVPLVEVKSPADLKALDPKMQGFLGECIRVHAMVEVVGGKKPGTYELKAEVDAAIAPMAGGKAQTNCVVAKLGGRYPVPKFVYDDPNKNQNANPMVTTGVKPKPGNQMQATVGPTICVDCQASTLPLPTRPQRTATAPVRPGRPGPIQPFGGGGGGGFSNGVGGFPGWNQSAGGAIASFSAAGPTLCYANIVSALQYKDSDFEVTATVVPPPGASIAAASASMSAGPGLAVQGGGPLSFAEGDDAVPGVGKADAEGLRFSWTLRGEEGRRTYRIRVEGSLSTAAGAASFGPMDLRGEIEIIQPFFLVGLSFPAAAVENGKRFDMVATVANSAEVTGTAFDVEMSVTATNATPLDPLRRLGNLAPGDAATAIFGFISALTGPIVGVSTTTSGRVSAEVSVGGAEASPPSYPIEVTPGLSALLARYPELAAAILAYAGAVFAQGLARQDRREVEAAASIGYALHRAGFRLLDGEPDVDVISALVLDAQGGATDNLPADALRRTSPVGRKVALAAGPALAQAAGASGVAVRMGFFERFTTAQGGEPLLAVLLDQAAPLTLRDASGRAHGERQELPFAASYDLNDGAPARLLALNRPEDTAFEVEIGAGAGQVDLLIPAPGGARRYRWALTRAAVLRVRDGEAELVLSDSSRVEAQVREIVADPPPRVVNASMIPATPYISPYRNLEVRFSEAVDIPSATDPSHYDVPGYAVERVSWYAPTRAAILFMDNPVLDGAAITVRDVVDTMGQPVIVQTLPIRGTAPAASVVGVARDPRGAPIPGARVAAFADAGYRETFADDRGAFELSPLPLGSFTLEVYDPSADRYGSSRQELVEPGQRLGVDPRVEPDGTVVGRVTDAQGRPIPRAIVNILARWPYETGMFTDDDGLYRFTNVPLGNFFVGVIAGELSSGASGRVQQVDEVVVLDVAVRPRAQAPGVLSGVVLAPDGLPAGGTVVRLSGDAAAQVTVGEDGAFRFGPFPGGRLRVEARDTFDRLTEAEIVLDGDRRLELRLPALGGLRVDVFDTMGAPLPGATVYINSMDGPRRSTDASGSAVFESLPAGPARVIAVLGDRLGVELVDILEGEIPGVLVRIFPEAFVLPAGLLDANGVRWTVGARGELRLTGNGFFHPGDGLVLEVSGARFTGGGEATTVTPGLELQLEQELEPGLRVRRRVYSSPADGFFVRVIDSFTNLGSTERRLPVRWTAARFDADPVEIRAGVIAAGGSAWVRGPFGEAMVAPARVEGRAALTERLIVLDPGQTRSAMHFLVTRPAADIPAAAALLTQPPARALAGIDAAVAASLVNAALPEARGLRSPVAPELERCDAELTVRTADQGLVGGARVNIQVHSPFYDQTGEGRAAPNGRVPFRDLVAGQLSARASHPETGATDTVGLAITPGAQNAADLVLRDTATVAGRVLRADGSPPGLCGIDIRGATTAVAVDGSFLQRGVPLGPTTVVARERQFRVGRSAPIQVAERGGVVQVEIRLPGLGIVTGRVLRGDGQTPVEGASLSLRSADPDNAESRQALSGVDGRFDFPIVPVGAYRIVVQSADAVGALDGEIRADGERVDADIVLNAVGVVKGRALAWDGAVLVGAIVQVQDSRRAQTVSTDTLGQYVAVGIAAGPVRLRVVPADGVGEGVAELVLSREGERLIADVRVDREPPQVRFLAPEGVVEGPMAEVAVEASDAERGLEPAGLRVLLNERDITGALEMVDGVRRGRVSVGPALRLGENRLRATVVDRAGNRAEAGREFRVAAGALRVRLSDAAGDPLSGVYTVIQDAYGERALSLDDGDLVELPAGPVALELEQGIQTPNHRYAQAGAAVVDGQETLLEIEMKSVGFLSVRVVARDGRSPAAGARIEIDRDGAITTFAADAGGSLYLRRIPTGFLRIRASFQGDSAEQALEVLPGETAFAEILPAGLASLEGIVRDPAGPVDGAEVALQIPGAETRYQVAVGGRFRFDGVRPGLQVTLFGSAPARLGQRGLIVLGPPTVTSADFVLAYVPRAEVAGLVLRFDGQPAADALVRLGNEIEARADAGGRFSLKPVRVGEFVLRARSVEGDFLDTLVSVRPETERLDLTVQLPGRGGVRLRVVRGTVPLADVEVYLRAFYGQSPVEARTDAAGMVEFTGLVAGAADLLVRDLDQGIFQFLYIPVQPGQSTEQEFRVPAFAEIRGRVFASDGITPLPGVSVRGSGAFSFFAQTDANGDYLAPEVFITPGLVRVEAYTLRQGVQDLRARVEREGPQAHREVFVQDLVFSPRGEVRGVLRGPDGPVARRPIEYASRGETYLNTQITTDDAGAFVFAEVPFGEFLLRANLEDLSLLGERSGQLSPDSPQTELDLPLSRAVRLPRSARLGNDRTVFIRRSGDISSFCELSFGRGDGAIYPRSSQESALVEDAGLLIRLDGEPVVERRVLADAGGYLLRWLDRVVVGPGEAIELVRRFYPLGRDSAELVESGLGWAIFRPFYPDYAGDYTALVWANAGPGAAVELDPDGTLILTEALPAGETAQRLCYVATVRGLEGARRAVERLRGGAPEAIAGLGAVGAVGDWTLPAAPLLEPLPPRAPRTITVRGVAGDGQSPLPLGQVELLSEDPFFGTSIFRYGNGDSVTFTDVVLSDGPLRVRGQVYLQNGTVQAAIALPGIPAEPVSLVFGEAVFARVRVRDGAPVQGVAVRVGFSSAVTDADGVARPGPFRAAVLLVETDGASGFVELRPGEGGELTLDLPARTTATATVLGQDGSPAPGVPVYTLNGNQVRASAFSDAGGRVSIPDQIALGLRVFVRDPVTQQAVIGSNGAALTLPGRGALRGRLLNDDGTPLPSRGVQIEPVPERLALGLNPDGVAAFDLRQYANTDGDGRFFFSDAPVGAVRLIGYEYDGRVVRQSVEIGADTEVELRMPPGAVARRELRLVVREAGAPPSEPMQVRGEDGATAPLDADGAATILVETGLARVLVESTAQPTLCVACWAREEAELVVDLPPRASLRCLALDADAEPVRYTSLHLFTEAGAFPYIASTGEDGAAEFPPLFAGSARVEVQSRAGAWSGPTEDLQAGENQTLVRLPRRGTVLVRAPGEEFGAVGLAPAGGGIYPQQGNLFGGEVRFTEVPPGPFSVVLRDRPAIVLGLLEPGQSVTVEIPPQPLATVFGQVRRGGAPWGRARVRADGLGQREVGTNELGDFLLTELPPGPFVLRALADDGVSLALRVVEVAPGARARVDLEVGQLDAEDILEVINNVNFS